MSNIGVVFFLNILWWGYNTCNKGYFYFSFLHIFIRVPTDVVDTKQCNFILDIPDTNSLFSQQSLPVDRWWTSVSATCQPTSAGHNPAEAHSFSRPVHQHALVGLFYMPGPWKDQSSETLLGWCPRRWQFALREASYPAVQTHLDNTKQER